jgi:hypothetical protein
MDVDELPVVGLAAGAAALLLKPVRNRVVPVAKAVGRVGRDVGAAAAGSFPGVVEAVRHGEPSGGDGGNGPQGEQHQEPAPEWEHAG